jgi:hypothetical protein
LPVLSTVMAPPGIGDRGQHLNVLISVDPN